MAGEQTKKRTSTAAKGSKEATQAAEEQAQQDQAQAAEEQQAKPDPEPDPEPNQDGADGGVALEVSTRLPRRIRAGVTVTREAAQVTVTEAVAKALEADRHIKVKRL